MVGLHLFLACPVLSTVHIMSTSSRDASLLVWLKEIRYTTDEALVRCPVAPAIRPQQIQTQHVPRSPTVKVLPSIFIQEEWPKVCKMGVVTQKFVLSENFQCIVSDFFLCAPPSP